eukprot:c1084_g1_i2.p1 GENE.c1084_g1_i2~~c1084_g1_i2.p1  ORF type:complete len:445 (+),score=108.53 c1084_g1_i2:84-1337(+)
MRQSNSSFGLSCPSSGLFKRIESALDSDPVDTLELKEIARVHGLGLSNVIRHKVWAKLLGINPYVLEDHTTYIHQDHKTRDIIERDVARSLFSFTVGLKKKVCVLKRDQLRSVVHGVVCKHPDLHYYQGFHDVCSVLVMVSPNVRLAFAFAERLAIGHLRDHMAPSFDRTTQQLHFMLALVKRCDGHVASFLNQAGVPPFFALSGVITWMSHDLHHLTDVCRLFDLFISSHPAMVLYYWVALMELARESILQLPPDTAIIHSALQKLPGLVPINEAIRVCLRMFHTHSPHGIMFPSFRSLASNNHLFRRYPFPWSTMKQHPDWKLQEASKHIISTTPADVITEKEMENTLVCMHQNEFVFVSHPIIPGVLHHTRKATYVRAARRSFVRHVIITVTEAFAFIALFIAVIAIIVRVVLP